MCVYVCVSGFEMGASRQQGARDPRPPSRSIDDTERTQGWPGLGPKEERGRPPAHAGAAGGGGHYCGTRAVADGGGGGGRGEDDDATVLNAMMT